VELLRFVGASVGITSGAQGGLSDLIVGWRRTNYILEVKDGAKAPSERRLTPAEQYFVDHWQGLPVAIVEDEVDALLAIGFSEPEAQLAVLALAQRKGRKRQALESERPA
jgi:hypothetical protein